MKAFFVAILLPFLVFTTSAQKVDCNIQDDFAAGGYDVVAYFSNKATEGSSKHIVKHDGVKYKFSSSANLDKFNGDPQKYIPQYGGWCAYAMGDKGEKVEIDPETFEIRDGKLYLFYNAYFNNTLKDWLEEPVELKRKADANWKVVMYKN